MSQNSPTITRIKKLFNIDVQAKEHYPKEYPASRPTPAPVFNMMKHHVSEPHERRSISSHITFRQAA